MVLNSNLELALDEILPIVENLLKEEKIELIQRLLNEQSTLDVNYLYGSVAGLIGTMNRDELSDTLKAIANRIAADGDIFGK